MNYRRGISRLGIALQVAIAVFCALVLIVGTEDIGEVVLFFGLVELAVWTALRAVIWIIEGFGR